MTPDSFDLILDHQINTCINVLQSKAEQYASDSDRLFNFKLAAKLQDTTLTKALAGMMAKHTVSIYEMISSGERYSHELWLEKITDNINYLILLRAVLGEEDQRFPREDTDA